MTGAFFRWAGLINDTMVKTRLDPTSVRPDFLFHDVTFANQTSNPPLLHGDWLVTQVSVVGGFKVRGRVLVFLSSGRLVCPER